jgi:putative ABC transport system permease protein
VISIAISVGFLAAASIISATESQAKTFQAVDVGGMDASSVILWVFAGIAMVTGLITISNTFTILLEQRRRQIGLLRSIGTSTTQIRRSIWLEAGFLGFVGSLLGIGLAFGLSAILAIYTGAIKHGLAVPYAAINIAFALGVVITMVAAIAPSHRATRVPPLEALRPTSTVLKITQGSIARAAICTLLVVVGMAGALYSLTLTKNALSVAILSAMAIALGVLFGARFYVPSMLKAAGWLVHRIGPTTSTAAKNLMRNPARTAATSTALMLAVGLIITLQVGTASMGATVAGVLDSEYPVELFVEAHIDPEGAMSLSKNTVSRLSQVSGIASAEPIECRSIEELTDRQYPRLNRVCEYTPQLAQLSPGLPDSIGDQEILVNEYARSSITESAITLAAKTGLVLVEPQASKAAMGNYAFVSPATYVALAGESNRASLVFMSLADSKNLATVAKELAEILKQNNTPGDLAGAAYQKSVLNTATNVILGVVTVLMGVAIVIALIGVGNTLMLSVLERTRDNATLRALGFKRGQLRVMLFIESMMLSLVAVIIGAGFGVFFGYLGTRAISSMFTFGVQLPVHIALNWDYTLALIGAIVVAAGLASVLPGRCAAKASPVASLAEA